MILENHVHLPTRSPDLGKDIRRFKSYSAQRILEVLEARRAERLLRMLKPFERRRKSESINLGDPRGAQIAGYLYS